MLGFASLTPTHAVYSPGIRTLFNPKKTTFACSRHRSNKGGGNKMSEWVNYPRHLVAICRRLCNVLIEHGDALDVIRLQDAPDTLFFVDPPYVHEMRDMSARYRHEMTDAQHIGLLTLLNAVQGKVMIAGYASDLYDGLLSGWTRLTRQHYAASGSGMQPRTEVLWIKPD